MNDVINRRDFIRGLVATGLVAGLTLPTGVQAAVGVTESDPITDWARRVNRLCDALDNEFSTEDLIFKCHARIIYSARDWRGVVGSAAG